uniref:hypothetical protein n=1 Tax=uncultured Altererythrobacter sp. TaxID=500840 RepID=UPI00261553A9|nr:hypothetical protein [uncultured Altererythrobacter sp.]
MTLPLTRETIQRLAKECKSVDWKNAETIAQLQARQYSDPRSREYANHGLGRRLQFIGRSIEFIFEVTPPDAKLVSIDQSAHASIIVQSHITNVFGALDNLARIWVYENSMRRDDGRSIPETWFGMGPGNKFVRSSLPSNAKRFLEDSSEWFKYLESFRHSLAHRIPLYVPHATISDVDAERAAQDLTETQNDAIKSGNLGAYSKALHEQAALGEFIPIIIHSYSEGSPIIYYHGQMLNDLHTVIDLTNMVLASLP